MSARQSRACGVEGREGLCAALHAKNVAGAVLISIGLIQLANLIKMADSMVLD